MTEQAESMLTCLLIWAASLLVFVLFLIVRSAFSWEGVILGSIATGGPACLLSVGFAVVGARGRPTNIAEAAALSLVTGLLIVATANLVFAFAPEMSADPITRGATALASWQLPSLIAGVLFLVLYSTRRRRLDSGVD
jgi:hypothetical protein